MENIDDLINEAENKIEATKISLDLWIAQKIKAEEMIVSLKVKVESQEQYLRILKERANK